MACQSQAEATGVSLGIGADSAHFDNAARGRGGMSRRIDAVVFDFSKNAFKHGVGKHE
jgi:hypothetical protein